MNSARRRFAAWTVAAGSVIALSGGAFDTAAADTAEPAYSSTVVGGLSIEATALLPGALASVSGAGFGAAGPVIFEFVSDDAGTVVLSASLTSDASGMVDHQFEFPDDLEPGQYRASVKGMTPDGADHILENVVTIRERAVAPSTTTTTESTPQHPDETAPPRTESTPTTAVAAEPTPTTLAVEDPAPEDPAPEDPAPEDPAPEDPAGEDPAGTATTVVDVEDDAETTPETSNDDASFSAEGSAGSGDGAVPASAAQDDSSAAAQPDDDGESSSGMVIGITAALVAAGGAAAVAIRRKSAKS